MSTLVIVLNIILSLGICALALFTWSRVKDALVLFIGLAFGLFAISHLVAAFGLAKSAEGLIILLSVLGYALVVVALYKELLPKRPTPPAPNAPK
jgi:hypothetical protein